MGVIYKLKDEVVHFIISQRQNNPLFSCRQLAESVSQQFGIHLSKSSVHDVLKESGVITPRGRKPKDSFQIPSEKKKQIQASLSQVMLPDFPIRQESESIPGPLLITLATDPVIHVKEQEPVVISPKSDIQESPPAPVEAVPLWKGDVYEGAGKVFLKAALWDLGIFSENSITESDWSYYLTYTAGIKVVLEDNSSYTIDLSVPLQRGIREVADGLINNIRPFIVHQVSDENFFKASMEAQSGFKIKNILLVDRNAHIICEFDNIMELKRNFNLLNRVFVENSCRYLPERAKELFFTQTIDNNKVMENILNLKGFDATNKDEYIVTILIEDEYANKIVLQQAIEKLNGMYLRDDQGKLLMIKTQNF